MSQNEESLYSKGQRLNRKGNRRGMSEKEQANLPKGWGNNADILEKHKWKPGQSGNPKGRPRGMKRRIQDLLNELLTKNQIDENTNLEEMDINAIEQAILSLDTKALQAVAKSEKTPTYMRTLAMAALWDMKNGKTGTMNLLRDRQFGAVKKHVDVTSNGQTVSQSLTPDEARDFLKEIEESC